MCHLFSFKSIVRKIKINVLFGLCFWTDMHYDINSEIARKSIIEGWKILYLERKQNYEKTNDV